MTSKKISTNAKSRKISQKRKRIVSSKNHKYSSIRERTTNGRKGQITGPWKNHSVKGNLRKKRKR